MESGVKIIIDELKDSNLKIRILTRDYLNITQSQALYRLKSELKDNHDLRFYSETNSFHPKAYIIHSKDDSEIYLGSSNMSREALTDSIEWNYHFKKSEKSNDFRHFQDTFEDLFKNHSNEVTDEVLRDYSKSWIRPKISKPPKYERNYEKFEPNPAQLEALYMLNQSREEGYEKALIVVATVYRKNISCSI